MNLLLKLVLMMVTSVKFSTCCVVCRNGNAPPVVAAV